MKMRNPFVFLFAVILSGCIKSMDPKYMSIEAFHSRKVGASARELLSDERYTSLKVEIQYMPGFKPEKESIEYLEKFMSLYLKKPGGISVVIKEIKAVDDTVLTEKQVVEIEKANRTVFTNGKEMGVYFLFTNSVFSNPDILGWAYHNTSAVVYGKSIRQRSGKFRRPTRSKLEATVLAHEFGHLLGLVNTDAGLKVKGANDLHEKHCPNRNCLMYYAVETREPSFIIKGAVSDLDKNCKAYLKANGGR